jgi:hypothetical protein
MIVCDLFFLDLGNISNPHYKTGNEIFPIFKKVEIGGWTDWTDGLTECAERLADGRSGRMTGGM